MNTNYMTSGLLLSLTLVWSGCMKPAPQSFEQKLEAISNAGDSRELIEVHDKDLADQFRKLEDSDDASLDQENLKDEENPNNKILIGGDSWASFACKHGSLKKVLKKVNAKMTADDRCGRTSKIGIEASEWIGSKQDRRIKEYLTKNDNVKYLYLFLGGNDLMANWNKDFTAQQEFNLSNQIMNNIKKSIAGYLAIRPQLKVIISGYDFPHFKENHKISLYKNIFKKMGKPSDQQINEALVRFTQYMSTIADFKNVYYINHVGLAQYYDGVKDQLSPLLTPPPHQISPFLDPALTGGDVRYPSSDRSMINWLWIIRDAFHFNEKNYDRLMQHTYDNVLVNIIAN